MPDKKKRAKEKISLLLSFLDEDNEEILKSIEKELMLLNEQENAILKQLIHEYENPEILDRVNNIITLNHFRFSETGLMLWLSSSERSLFDLLTIIATIEYPDIDCKSLKLHYNKMLREIWASIPADSSSLDVAKLLKSVFFEVQNYKMLSADSITIKHIMVNDVLHTKETNKIFLNIFYLCVARDLGIPVAPFIIDSLLVLAFENKKPYAISFIDNKFLFFIDNTTLLPYPEAKLRQKFNINDDRELPFESFSDTEIAVTLLNWLGDLYLKNKKEVISGKIMAIIKRIEREV